MDHHLRVAFATDNGYVNLAGISMVSLFQNNREFEKITVYILDNGISEQGKNQLSEIAIRFNRQIFFIDCRAIGEWLGNDVMEMFRTEETNVPIIAYARIFLPKLLDDCIEKILYLDVDSIIVGSYMELWNTNIDQYAALGVLDNVSSEARKKVGLPETFGYINSGVLLMNLNYLRTMCFVEMAKEFILRYHGRVYHHDQGIINGVLKDKIGILPPQYNMLSFFFEKNSAEKIRRMYNLPEFYSEQEYEYAKEHPVFIHFTEGNLQRPWVENCKHPLKSEWEKYRDQTVWKFDPLKKDQRSFKLKLLAWMNLNLPIEITKKIIKLAAK